MAIPIPAPLHEQLAALHAELGNALPGLRWARPETVHLTLRFFAAATADDLEKIRASMLSITFGIRPFDVELTGLGAFPDPRHPRVVWIGIVPAEPVQGLHRACEAELRRQGLPGEQRPFAPHLTVGRFRDRGPDLTAVLAGQSRRRFGCLPVTQLVLYESRLRPEGPRHIPLFTVPLAERDDPLHNDSSQEGSEHD